MEGAAVVVSAAGGTQIECPHSLLQGSPLSTMDRRRSCGYPRPLIEMDPELAVSESPTYRRSLWNGWHGDSPDAGASCLVAHQSQRNQEKRCTHCVNTLQATLKAPERPVQPAPHRQRRERTGRPPEEDAGSE